MKKECHLLRDETKAKVDSIMELMTLQRLKLSQKFAQSQEQSDKLRTALADARQSPNQRYHLFNMMSPRCLQVTLLGKHASKFGHR